LNAGAGTIMGGFLQITVLCVKRNPLVVEKVHPRTSNEVREGGVEL